MTGKELRHIRDSRGATREAFADFLGVKSVSTLTKWERDENPVPSWVDEKLLKTVPVTLPLDDLAMLLQHAAKEGVSFEGLLSQAIREHIKRSSTHLSAVIPFPTHSVKPHLQAAAGSPIDAAVQDWDGADDTVLVQINGLSMEPLLSDGQIVTMKHRRASRSDFMKKGGIYLVAYDGGYTVKRFNSRPATKEEIAAGISYTSNDGKSKVRVLQSLNPEYKEIVIKDDAEWIAWLPKA